MKFVCILTEDEWNYQKEWITDYFKDCNYADEDITDELIQNHLRECFMENDLYETIGNMTFEIK